MIWLNSFFLRIRVQVIYRVPVYWPLASIGNTGNIVGIGGEYSTGEPRVSDIHSFIQSLHEYYYSVISLKASRTPNIVTTRRRNSKLCDSGCVEAWKHTSLRGLCLKKETSQRGSLQVTLEGSQWQKMEARSRHVPLQQSDCPSAGWRNHQRRRGCWTQPPSRVAVSHTT